ncbi:glycosyl transferase [Flavobacterium noncentrifugens]|uniref:Glycosyltransferase, GT2 family n=1 Tax=Flavobacterium noncentrifugens TaxID=1128970 RepID=A0A1G8VAR6_9FLAO|nr:glycosyltransferase family A protein [Flavobacterium noncentrifugens]GEP50412.1 glycosyl transferase [Flavobacterium noncentrifugens]SDJ62984.1 Glycosyltransferase, GT2 family [Flavobacterium noncentrifugens]
MIIVYHKNNTITAVAVGNAVVDALPSGSIVSGILQLAKQHPDDILIWCHDDLKQVLDTSRILKLFHHKKLLFSYRTSEGNFLDSSIGYAEESIYIKVNKKVTYPTWQMSSEVGAVHTSVLNACRSAFSEKDSLDYFLNSFAKRAMPAGLFCYSEPRLIAADASISETQKLGKADVFRFVKQHYKSRWILLLLMNLFLHKREFPLAAFLKSVFYKSRTFKKSNLSNIAIQSSKQVVNTASIDVIIPTIGRKKYLYDVLKDLAAQTHLPEKVIIVEQNPLPGSTSELDYLDAETWPFAIKHIFTHQAGACNARNVCLSHTTSEYVFLADDDNRFEPDLIEKVFDRFRQFGAECLQISYPQPKEKIKKRPVYQYPNFGAGNAFVRRSCLQDVAFNMAFEFGYDEDKDFGMQLRNKGFDILYLTDLQIVHLKAPMGGFRTKPVLLWSDAEIPPKPAPTVMLYLRQYYTKEQISGYKTNLYFKYYKYQHIRNPFPYYKAFSKQWESSVFWARKSEELS